MLRETQLTWHDVELVWIDYLKTKDKAIYKKYRELAVKYAEQVWGKNYELIKST